MLDFGVRERDLLPYEELAIAVLEQTIRDISAEPTGQIVFQDTKEARNKKTSIRVNAAQAKAWVLVSGKREFWPGSCRFWCNLLEARVPDSEGLYQGLRDLVKRGEADG